MKIRELFDQCATGYDQDRPKLVPCFNDFYGAALNMVPFAPSAKIDILELGTGTGLLASMVARLFPDAHLHLTDISAAMLAQAQSRFADVQRITYALQDHLQLSAEGKFDLVISALSIHHLEHGDKKALFQRVFRALRSGGVFINADQASGPTPQEEAAYERGWLAEVKANNVSVVSLENARVRMREDRNATLAEQLAWLAESGFWNVRCGYERTRFVVYGGEKNDA
ncbi:MAG: trans-aconitate 2-methyltransferase [Desulfobulbus sp.]